MTPTKPTKIGKYEVERLVGEGAMGVVYRATDPVLNRPVAIKVMSDALAQDSDLRERFLREARAAGSLQHPNVITIYDFGEVDGHPYIAMEFVAGSDLEELLAHHVPLTVDHALDLMTGVLQGLGYAHKRGIVHRDVKPANIRVDDEGKARLMDFGVAHLTSSSMTRTGVMLGTPSYMAPEQIVGEKIGPATDIFSVGAVLYELLSGSRPFQGDTLQSVMYKVLNEMPPSLTKVTPRVPAKLDRIVARALAKNPGDRYDSALEMANELIAVRASLHAGAPPAHMLSLRATIDTALESERSAASVRRRRRRAVVYGAGALAAVALLVAGWSLAPRAAPSRPAAPATGRSAVPPADSTAALEATTHRPAMAKPAEPPPRSDASTAHQSRTTDGSETRLRTRVPPGSGSAPVSGAGATGAAPRDVRRDPAGPSTASIPLADTMARGGSAPPKVSGTPGGGTLPAGEPRPQGPMPLVSAPQSPTAGAANATAPLASSPAAATSSTGSTSAKPDANTAPEIGAAIDAYAHAIESRDVAQLRQAFPAMTAEQQRAFADFFAGTRSLHASLAVSNLHVDGADATVRVTGSYEFVTTGGRDNRQAVDFQAELRYARGAWRLAVIR